MRRIRLAPGRRRAVTALLAFFLLLGIASPVLAAAIDPSAAVHAVNYSYPASGDSSPNNWGRPELYFLGGWFTSASGVWWVHSFREANNVVAYCIEPGAARDDAAVDYTSRGADYWESFVNGTAGTHGGVLNPTIDGPTIRTLIGRIMEYGYQGEISSSWQSQNAADAEKLAELTATQILIWEAIVGERDAAFDHVDPSGTGTYKDGGRTFTHARDPVLAYISENHPLRARIMAHYDRIVREVKRNALLPSFMADSADAAQTAELSWNGAAAWADGRYTLTLTDTNDVLSDYTFSGTGLTFSVSGNTLTVTSDSPISSPVTVTAATTRKTNSFVTWSDGKVGFNVRSKQDVVTYGTPVSDDVTAYLKVTAPATGITVTKQSDDGRVADISFDLLYGDEIVATETTDAEGRASFGGLPVGAEFTVTENVPEGYTAEEASQTVTLTEGTNAVTFVNHPDTVTLDLVKRSDDGNVAGISFEVESAEGDGWTSLGTFTTGEDGTLAVPDLTAGTRLRITEDVPAYYRAEERTQEITVTADSHTVTFVNHPTADLEIVKTSEDGRVAGIVFRVEQTAPEERDLGSFETDDGGRISVTGLAPGAVLRVTEEVPEGCVCDEPVREVTLVRGLNRVNYVNRTVRGSLKISKTTRLSGSEHVPVEGAVYAVYDADHTIVLEAATDRNGEVTFGGLAYGEYTYQEIRAPEGFERDGTEYAFRITEDGETVTEERENDRKRGSLSVFKTDENGTALSGVVFLLEYSLDEGATWQPVRSADGPAFTEAGACAGEGLADGTLETGEDGMAVFSGLAVSTPVQTIRYRLTEVRTKDGYSLLADAVFEGELTDPEATELGFTVVNRPVFTMPVTGGSGFGRVIAAAAGAACLACASAFLLVRSGKGETAG